MTLAFFYFDPTYFLYVGPFIVLAMIATWRVRSTFLRFSNVGVRSGMTGAQAAAAVARAGGADVSIERHQGFLSDHYDPTSRTLRLSPDVYDGRSVASIAVAAHEAGHAIQDARAYAWLGIRSALVPVVKVGSMAWVWVFMAGLLLSTQAGQQTPLADGLMLAGIGLFGATVLFQVVTLPVEFDASRRAKAVLVETGIVSNDAERDGVSRVLNAAAMTYVAAALTSIATLIYLLSRRRD
jgi:Zn-dependent membrane protease YugP